MVTPRSFKVRKCGVFCAGALVALALFPAPARAGMFAFTTPTGAMAGGGPVNAEADLTTTAGSILVTLSNSLASFQLVVPLWSYGTELTDRLS